MKLDSIPIFCINLNTKSEKYERVKKRLNYYNLEVIRWEAVTPTEVPYQEYNFVNYLNLGQKGCTSSHLNLYKYMLNNNIDVALILEDDASFRYDWKNIVDDKLKNIDTEDPEWQCLFLNVSEEISPIETWTKITNQCLSAGYIINKKGIHFILDHFKDLYYCIDWMTQVLQSRNHCYSYFPWLIIQENHKSDTRGEDLEYNPDYLKVKRLLITYKYPLSNYDLMV